MPARDAEAYLWMADRIAEGELSAAFETVFHPGLSLCVGALRWLFPALPSVGTAQTVSCTLAACAVIPLYVATRRGFGTRAAAFAGLAYALGLWFARHPADALSEGPFFLLVALAMQITTSARRGLTCGLPLGVVAGLAFAFRPEGAALALLAAPWLFFLRRDRTASLAVLAAAALTAAPLVIGWSLKSGAVVFTPKAAFNYAQGIGSAAASDSAGAIAHYAEHAARLALTGFDAIGFFVLPLAIYGAWTCRHRITKSPAIFWLAVFALQCAVVPALRSNVRFLAGFAPLLLPFAGSAAALCSRHIPRPAVRAALLVLCFAPDLVRLPAARRTQRTVLIEMGNWLAQQLRPDEQIVTEMPRLAYFAGRRPPPPRPIDATELIRWSHDPNVRFVCTLPARSWTTRSLDDAFPGFTPVALPPALATKADARGMIVLER